MANTYSQMYVQSVFAVKHRANLISKNWSDELYRYVPGILHKIGIKSLAVNGWCDHIHIFFSLKPSTNVEDIMRIVKSNSSKWINERRFTKSKFEWQNGYGAFTYKRSDLDVVINYIKNQEMHHSKTSFRKEYMGLLTEFEIEYDSKYLFDYFDDL